MGVNREEQTGDRKTMEQPRVLARVERIDGLQEIVRENVHPWPEPVEVRGAMEQKTRISRSP